MEASLLIQMVVGFLLVFLPAYVVLLWQLQRDAERPIGIRINDSASRNERERRL